MLWQYLKSKRNRKRILSLLVFLFIVLASHYGASLPSETIIPTPAPIFIEKREDSTIASESARVIRVIDGDTIELENSLKVRYIGIDTPEISGRKIPDCFAEEAYIRNKELVEGKTVILEKDISETDRYGRLLRYVYVDSIFVNDYLVKEGYALARAYPPDISHQNVFNKSEEEARIAKKGLWGDVCQ